MINLDNLRRSAQRRLHKALERDCAAACDAIKLDFQRARRALRLPPVLLGAWKWHRLPARFVCPECGGRLIIEVDEWSPATGIPTAGGIRLMCEAEEEELYRAMQADADPEWSHRSFQSDWEPVHREVERFCASAVRVDVSVERVKGQPVPEVERRE